MNKLLSSLQFTADSSGEGAYLYAASTQSAIALEALKKATELTFRQVWRNVEFTPEQMIAAMGNKAVTNFDRHAATVGYLLSMGVQMKPESYTPPREYTKNAEGTITLK